MTTTGRIAAVTQTVAYIVRAAVRVAVPEADFSVNPPEEPQATNKNAPRLNVYLVQVEPEPTLRNADLPTRSADGQLVSVPQVALKLRYLLSFFGVPPASHRMLGATELALREHAVLEPDVIAAALEDLPDLQAARLEEQVPRVHLAPRALSLEELARFWSGFFQTTYTLSTMYEASAVILTSELTPQGTFPVARVNVRSGPLAPRLDPPAPVDYAPRAPVPVSGPGLGPANVLLLGDAWAPVEPVPDGLRFRLPADVPAGVSLVRVGVQTPDGPVPLPGGVAQPLTVRPALNRLRFDPSARVLTADVTPAPRPGQRTALVVAGLATAATPPQRLASIPGAPTRFDAAALGAGRYVAMFEVDGIASLPGFVNGAYAKPSVSVK